MEGCVMLTGYQENAALRAGFNELAGLVFGLDFEAWYRKGFWTHKYRPYTLFEDGRAVSNVSVNRMELIVRGQRRQAVQLGTVMTRPGCRGRGYASLLMRRVLGAYASCGPIYLFANPSAFGFYPKFGFERVQQSVFELPVPAGRGGECRKLDLADPADLALLREIAACRRPVSQTLGAADDRELLLFYCESFLKDCLYELPRLNAVAVIERDGGLLLLEDVLCRRPFALDDLLCELPREGAQTVRLGFTPDLTEARRLQLRISPAGDEDALFMRPVPDGLRGKKFLFPLLSHA
jgi:GNAT superfamily N-acetyltransferase